MIEKYNATFVNETRGFTVLSSLVIQFITEFDVLGLYVYLASKPESWKPNPKELIRHTGYSKDKVYRLINRLISLNLLSCKEVRDKGKFSTYEYTLHISPCPEKPDTEKPDPEKPDAYKIKSVLNKDKENINARDDDKSLSKEIKPIEYQDTYYENPNEAQEKLKYEPMIKEMISVNPFRISELLIRTWANSQKQKNKPINSGIWALMIQDCYKYKESGLDPLEAFETMVKKGWDSLNLKQSLAFNQKDGDKNSTGYINSGFLNKGGL